MIIIIFHRWSSSHLDHLPQNPKGRVSRTTSKPCDSSLFATCQSHSAIFGHQKWSKLLGHESRVFFLSLFEVVFGLMSFSQGACRKQSTRGICENHSTWKMTLPQQTANCSCSLGVFIVMSQDGNLKEFCSSSSRFDACIPSTQHGFARYFDSSYKLCRKSKRFKFVVQKL